MTDPRQIRIHPHGTRVTDPSHAVRLSETAPTAFRKTQDLLVATKKYLEEHAADHGAQLDAVQRELNALATALQRDRYVREAHTLNDALLFRFLSEFSDSFPNSQAEYEALNRLIPMCAVPPEDVNETRARPLPRTLQQLALQYRGSTLPKLVQTQIRSQSEERLLMAIKGTFDEFPIAYREPLDQFTQEYLQRWFGPQILDTDLSEIFSQTVQDIKSTAKTHGLSLSDEMVFDVFNLMVMKMSHFASSRSDFRKQLGIKKGLFW